MVKHIVMWKFRDGEEENAEKFLSGLQSLYGVIDELKFLETGRGSGGGYDAVMISEFNSFDDLEKYKNDPRHKAVSALCKSIRESRACVDYEF